MKKYLSLISVLIIFAFLFSSCGNKNEKEYPQTKDSGKIFYVAVNGNDSSEGSKESPLATLAGAVEKVREYKLSEGIPEGGIKVEFASGNYYLPSNVTLSSSDSGEDGNPIVYAAEKGAEVIFNGGVALDSSLFSAVTDEEVLSCFKNDDVRKSVLVIDLSDDKYSDLFADNSDFHIQELSVNGKTAIQARWPDNDEAPAEILSDDGQYTYLAITDEQAEAWSRCNNISWHGYGNYDWLDFIAWSSSVDTSIHALKVPDNVIIYLPVKDGMPFYVFNLLCELDRPGEYYFDASARKLYYFPSSSVGDSTFYLSANSTGAFAFDNASDIEIDGIIFENYCSEVISGKVSDFTLNDSVIHSCSGQFAVKINGTNNTINGCRFYDLSRAVLSVTGSDTVSMAASNNIITNNEMFDTARVRRTTSDSVQVFGSGFYIAHNKIYDTPDQCIRVEASNTVVEYNEIFDAVKTASDAGAIYAGRRFDWKGIVIRYNYIHDIRDYLFNGIPHAVYFDDNLSFVECYGNIIVDIAGHAVICGGGRNLKIYNNVLVNTGDISIDARGAAWYPTVTSYPDGYLWTTYAADNYLTPLWRYCTPELLSVLEMRTTEELRDLKGIDFDILDSPAPPAYGNIYNNIGCNNGIPQISERKNYIFNRNEYIALNNNEDGSNPASSGMEYSVYVFGKVADNLEYTTDLSSVFIDPDNGNFFLKEDSKVYREIIGFEKWDYSLIGPQK